MFVFTNVILYVVLSQPCSLTADLEEGIGAAEKAPASSLAGHRA